MKIFAAHVGHDAADGTVQLGFVRSLGEYSFGTLGYGAPAIVLVAMLVAPSGAAVRDSWFATDPIRRPATLLFWTPLVFPVIVGLALWTDMLSLWNAPAFNLLPVMMLASPLVVVSRIAVVRLAAIVTAVTLAVVAISPLVALTKLKQNVENNTEYASLVAAAAEREWRQTTTAPLRLVGGPFALADGSLLYGRSAFDLRRLFTLLVAVGGSGATRARGSCDYLPGGRRRLPLRPEHAHRRRAAGAAR